MVFLYSKPSFLSIIILRVLVEMLNISQDHCHIPRCGYLSTRFRGAAISYILYMANACVFQYSQLFCLDCECESVCMYVSLSRYII